MKSFSFAEMVPALVILLTASSVLGVSVTSPSTVHIGESIPVAFTTDAVVAGDVIGMFRAGSCPSSNDCMFFSSTVNAASTTVTFSGITNLYPLTLDFRYVRAGASLASSAPTTVTASATLTAKPIYQPGEPFIVQYTTSPHHDADDFIGIFLEGTCNVTNDCWFIKLAVPAGGSGPLAFPAILGPTPALEVRYVMASTLLTMAQASTRVEVLPGCPYDCFGYGQCISGSCQCIPGLQGNCSASTAWTTMYVRGGPSSTTGTRSSVSCPGNCNRHGICNKGQCSCFVGFRSPFCTPEPGAAVLEDNRNVAPRGMSWSVGLLASAVGILLLSILF
eukprot:TRINITY_DN2002_c0_g1_i4.p2 TRINITY_DN2002_c0_g1~~TRINITY_DN2002_c0_g1_i4.p2  ORF type:complete len:334 (-),score=76.06 TRINITY_DN2002_c0_g1_i4:1817-2818(-)